MPFNSLRNQVFHANKKTLRPRRRNLGWFITFCVNSAPRERGCSTPSKNTWRHKQNLCHLVSAEHYGELTQNWRFACDKRERAITYMFSYRKLHLTIMFTSLLQKDLLKGRWSLRQIFFKQNNCHACHTSFAVFFSLPFCCVSSLLPKKESGTSNGQL